MDICAQVLPWQKDIWQHWQQQKARQRLPHAILLTGMPGVGKRQLAAAFAQALLCEQVQSDGQACGHCAQCHLVAHQQHPDLHWIQPEREGGGILIEAMRQLRQEVNQSAQQSGYRLFILTPAEALNTYAANALLKSLEEPGVATLFILISDQSARVLPTIKSRCQHWQVKTPAPELALAWLAQVKNWPPEQAKMALRLASGAPLQAVHCLDADYQQHRQAFFNALDHLLKGFLAIQAAHTLQAWSLEANVQLYLSWLKDTLVYQMTQNTEKLRHLDQIHLIQESAALLTRLQILQLYQLGIQLSRQVQNKINPNKALLLEALWLQSAHFLKAKNSQDFLVPDYLFLPC